MSDDNLRDRLITRAPDVGFTDTHHTHTRPLKVGPNLPPAGGSDGVESVFIRCRQCGFVIDASKTNPGNPLGNEVTVTTYKHATITL